MTLTDAFRDTALIYKADTIGDGVPAAPVDALIRAQVISEFSDGFYLKSEDGQICAIGSPRIPPGPIHLLLKHPPPQPGVGSPVKIYAQRLEVGAFSIDLTSSTRYSPFVPRSDELGHISPVLTQLARSIAVPQDIEPVMPELISALQKDDLEATKAVLEGMGSGLTPTGDDVLAGILLFHAWSNRSAKVLQSIAHRTQTNQLSRAFLRWAAEGQCIGPVHTLLVAARDLSHETCADRARQLQARCDQSAKALCAIGHTSGAALLKGLGLAAQFRPATLIPASLQA